MTLTKADYRDCSQRYLIAFQRTAEILGKAHVITKAMGALAWGRHGAERGPDQNTVRACAVEYGFLRGCERTLVSVCNALGETQARTVLLDQIREAERR